MWIGYSFENIEIIVQGLITKVVVEAGNRLKIGLKNLDSSDNLQHYKNLPNQINILQNQFTQTLQIPIVDHIYEQKFIRLRGMKILHSNFVRIFKKNLVQ